MSDDVAPTKAMPYDSGTNNQAMLDSAASSVKAKPESTYSVEESEPEATDPAAQDTEFNGPNNDEIDNEMFADLYEPCNLNPEELADAKEWLEPIDELIQLCNEGEAPEIVRQKFIDLFEVIHREYNSMVGKVAAQGKFLFILAKICEAGRLRGEYKEVYALRDIADKAVHLEFNR